MPLYRWNEDNLATVQSVTFEQAQKQEVDLQRL